MKMKKNLLVLLAALMLCVSALCVNAFAATPAATATISVPEDQQTVKMIESKEEPGIFTQLPGSVETPEMKPGLYKVEVTHTAEGEYASSTYYPGVQVGGASLTVKYPAPASGTRVYTVYANLPAGVSTLTFFEYFATQSGKNFDIKPTEVKLTLVEEYKSSTVFFTPKSDMTAEIPGETPAADISYWKDSNGSYYPAADILTVGKRPDSSPVDVNAITNGMIAHSGSTSKTGFGNAYDFREGQPGGVYFRNNDELRFAITAPKAGVYAVYAPTAVNADSVTLTWKTKTSASGEWGTPTETQLSKKNQEGTTSSATAAQWDMIGVLDLKEGVNYISLTSKSFTVAQMAFVNQPSYKITWKDHDGTTLKEENVPEGTLPSYGEDPTRDTTPTTEYTFAGWSPAVTAATADVTYTATYTESAHTHTYGNLYQKDENGHWKICKGCNEAQAVTPHVEQTDDGDCTTDLRCKDCLYVITRANEDHTGGTATCQEKAECFVCGTAYGELGDHVFTENMKDETHHWKKCTHCDATEEKVAHDFTSGACVCGAEKPAEKGGCGASIASGAVLVTALLGLGVGFVRKKKRQ